jgi:hypothetical protein
VFVGKSGQGPWQTPEVEAVLREQVRDLGFRVIPVLLPDAPQQPKLPTFLAGRKTILYPFWKASGPKITWQERLFVPCAVVPGSSIRPGRARRSVSGSVPIAGTSMWVFGVALPRFLMCWILGSLGAEPPAARENGRERYNVCSSLFTFPLDGGRQGWG